MVNRKRKHGVFAVNGDVVVLSNAKEERVDCTHINYALDTVFNQMRIAGNKPRSIESYADFMSWDLRVGEIKTPYLTD